MSLARALSIASPTRDTPRAPVTDGRWAAIWRNGHAMIRLAPRATSQPLFDMTLCLEFTVPPPRRGTALRLWQGAADPDRAICLYAMPDGALRLVHGEIDISTEAGFARSGETVTLRYRSCARGRADIADFRNADRPLRRRLRAGLPHLARLDEALPRDPRFLSICHVAAIAEFGLLPTDLPALDGNAILQTTRGPVAARNLKPGMHLLTVTGQPMPLRWIEARPRLCLGRNAPVLMRAPYFGLTHDICVTPETRVLRSGPAVEYIFDHEMVLMAASDMTASPGAFRDRREPVRYFFHLMLDDHACVSVDRCGVETALLADVVAATDHGPRPNLSEADRTPCLPVLDRAGAQALISASAKGRRSLI